MEADSDASSASGDDSASEHGIDIAKLTSDHHPLTNVRRNESHMAHTTQTLYLWNRLTETPVVMRTTIWQMSSRSMHMGTSADPALPLNILKPKSMKSPQETPLPHHSMQNQPLKF
jgi:hypothetical protein